MKKTLFTTGLIALLMMGLWAVSAAPAPTSFAGTWSLDKGKSEGLNQQLQNAESITLTITQDDKELTTKQEIAGSPAPPQTATYKLDGSETTGDVNLGRMQGKATRKAKWMDGGKMIELHSVINVEFQGNPVTITQVQHLELAEGGKVLKIHSTSESPRGTQESKLTYNKK
ncbi:MAG: hypothetical protein U0Z53_03635 [Blastocatellia bacterium]